MTEFKLVVLFFMGGSHWITRPLKQGSDEHKKVLREMAKQKAEAKNETFSRRRKKKEQEPKESKAEKKNLSF